MIPHPQFESGSWTGFYLDARIAQAGWMQLYLDCDDRGVLRGEGVDYVGPWTLAGRFDADSKRCFWTKQYLGQHSVDYEGNYGDSGIVGEWTINVLIAGRFHIWPQRMGFMAEHYLGAEVPIDVDRENETHPAVTAPFPIDFPRR